MPLFGKNAKLYYDPSLLYEGTLVPNDMTWIEMDRVQDASDNYAPIEDDVTTRAIAASGVAASAIILSEVEITFSYIMDATDSVFAALWAAFHGRNPIAVLTLSGAKTSTDSIGFSANFSVTLNWQKNVRNKQLANFGLKVLQYPFWVTGQAAL